MRNYYAESNRYLASEFDLPLAQHGYPLGDAETAPLARAAGAAGYRAAS